MVRRLLRFRLWHLLLLLTLVASLAAWYRHSATIRAQELAAIDALDLETFGDVHVSYGFQFDRYFTAPAKVQLRWAGPWFVPESWRHSAWGDVFHRVDCISLNGSSISDQPDDRYIDILLKFEAVREIEIYNSRLTYEGIDRLKAGLHGTTLVLYVPTASETIAPRPNAWSRSGIAEPVSASKP
ncbi:hypothetical protein [Aeoliella mucimassa]|uniref:Uncharacterized protein n=1 Tax=Aeoliella mucimassa TaxID=2527972 RepID=A0A518AV15_9BACT|nr:hypothetical protein [Aeoliella mucimassa]QDU58569.1 hypothetical protein Pan181_48080 [Aeoliella mucimassa]